MITVLTATYNRAYTLGRLYESLEKQTNKSFEWVVVDDGSQDETLSLLEEFQQNSSFSIKILQQENAGKHIAINTGVPAGTGDWVLLVDSDDALTSNAIEVINEDLQNLDTHGIAGLCYRRADLAGNIIGAVFSDDDIVASKMTPTEAANHFLGDLAYVFKKSALLKHPFPRFKDEIFVPELLIWNRISDEGEILYFYSKYIYLCEYLPDGYSANFFNNLKRNPQGFGLFYKEQVLREAGAVRKLKCIVRYFQCVVFRVSNRRKI